MRHCSAILRRFMHADEHAQNLDALATALGVTRSYHDGTGTYRRAADEAVLAVLRALGAPVERIEDCTDALRARQSAGAVTTPIVVLRSGDGGMVEIPSSAKNPATLEMTLESGESLPIRSAPQAGGGVVAGIPRDLPIGYHLLQLGSQCAPLRVHVAPPTLPPLPRSWGLFAPLYGFFGSDSVEAPVYGDLRRLAQWMTATAGVSRHHRDTALLGTLPLLACFFEGSFEPSPYSPISRAFWSELYVDPYCYPDLLGKTGSDPVFEARQGTAGDGLAKKGSDPVFPDAARRIDYRRAMQQRRGRIDALLRALDARDDQRRDRFECALEEDDELARYAAFRAAVEQHAGLWTGWPERARSGRLRAGVDYDGATFRYHAFAQWLAREQVAGVAADSPAGLYLDLPLGSHGAGYDTWRHQGDFAFGMSVGAPPDAVFEGGQNWAFPPLQPERLRAGGYASVRAALRHHFEHAALLRIDHVMGLHRSFWIPDGFTAADGVYVRSWKDEMWSVVAIEAARARAGRGAAVVGEDLGTVPDEVREEMRARGALRMHVVPFECRDDPAAPVVRPPRDALACLGTHDMEPFASWWQQPHTRRDLLCATLACEQEPCSALGGLLEWLSAGDATVVCANLEDFWLERERQNMPGTESGERNWQRPFARSFASLTADPSVRALVRRTCGCNASGDEPSVESA